MTWATRTSAEGEACTGATGATATRRATAGGYGGSEMATRQRPVHRSALHGEKLRNGAVGAKVNNALSSSDAQRWADVFCCCVRETPQKMQATRARIDSVTAVLRLKGSLTRTCHQRPVITRRTRVRSRPCRPTHSSRPRPSSRRRRAPVAGPSGKGRNDNTTYTGFARTAMRGGESRCFREPVCVAVSRTSRLFVLYILTVRVALHTTALL